MMTKRIWHFAKGTAAGLPGMRYTLSLAPCNFIPYIPKIPKPLTTEQHRQCKEFQG